MINKNRLGLGCMGMNLSNKARSIETVRYALDQGITLLNTGEFYGGGESELVLREALAGVPRDKYFLSVKFGVLPKPGGDTGPGGKGCPHPYRGAGILPG